MSFNSLITPAQRLRLLQNGLAALIEGGQDPHPVVKLVCPALNATWLLSEIDPEQPGIAYGLRFAGRGLPELGYVDLRHLARLAGRAETRIERDLAFKADKPISVYAERSRAAGRIVA